MPLLERELAVGIRGVVVHVVLASAQQAALLQKALDASHHALEHAPYLSRRQVRQRVEDDVCAFFLVDPIEKEHVKVSRVCQAFKRKTRSLGATLANFGRRSNVFGKTPPRSSASRANNSDSSGRARSSSSSTEGKR